jgi:hypothetical protein
MTFTGINYIAVLIAAFAAWGFGAAWYNLLATPWLAAQGKTPEQFEQEMKPHRGSPRFYTPFVLAFVCNLIMAWVLAGMIAHLGPVTIRSATVSAAFVWFGFVLTTMSVNYAFGGRKPLLTVIDGGHWLGALLIMGAVIGAFGS